MADTFSQIYIQIVFAVQFRQSLIPLEHREELHKYITGILTNKNQMMLAINSRPDHIHFLFGMKPNTNLADLVREVKKSSTNFVKDKRWVRTRFNWQSGYGAFSYSRSSLDKVIQYIKNQDAHHGKRSFKEEYITLLRKF